MLTISFFTTAFVFVFSGVFFFGLGLFTEFSSEIDIILSTVQCIAIECIAYKSPRKACVYGIRRDNIFLKICISLSLYMFVPYTLFGDDAILTFFLEL